jgi:Ca2+/Na+ antiporter
MSLYGGPVAAGALDDSPGILLHTGPTNITSISAHNTTGSDAFIQMFNAAALADVTLGTTVPDYVVPLSANLTTSFDASLHFGLGCCVFSTTAIGGSTAAVVDAWFGVG